MSLVSLEISALSNIYNHSDSMHTIKYITDVDNNFQMFNNRSWVMQYFKTRFNKMYIEIILAKCFNIVQNRIK